MTHFAIRLASSGSIISSRCLKQSSKALAITVFTWCGSDITESRFDLRPATPAYRRTEWPKGWKRAHLFEIGKGSMKGRRFACSKSATGEIAFSFAFTSKIARSNSPAWARLTGLVDVSGFGRDFENDFVQHVSQHHPDHQLVFDDCTDLGKFASRSRDQGCE
jgi:hypothetical protein